MVTFYLQIFPKAAKKPSPVYNQNVDATIQPGPVAEVSRFCGGFSLNWFGLVVARQPFEQLNDISAQRQRALSIGMADNA